MTEAKTPSDDSTATEAPDAPLSRRKALAKLGIAAAIAYTAPTVLHLDRSANAFILPTPCKGKGKGKRPCLPNPGKGRGGGLFGSGYRDRFGGRGGGRAPDRP